MTHYWWMHWFWITCRLTLCIVLTHSTPLTPLSTVGSQSQLEEAEQYRSHRPLNLSEETKATVPFSSTETSTNTESDPASCRNQTNTNSTTPVQICSTFYSDSLQVDSTETSLDENVTVTATADTINTTVIATQTQSKELIGAASSWNAASITGVSVGVLLTAAVLAAASAVLYRRRYLNKPQTLNDKCSNPDSSGYIDDSTMRENSEEMYSLDNDSFLNSLEAMTIQNYWTDSVKHTKL